MKTLFVSELLIGRDAGCKVASRAHAMRLKEISESMTMVCLIRPEERNAVEDGYFSEFDDCYFIDAYHNKFENIKNILCLYGWAINHSVINEIINIIRSDKYDVIFIDDSVLGRLAKRIKRVFPDITIVTFYHDIKGVLAKQWIKNGGLKVVPFNMGLMINEKINTIYADYNLVLNERDRKLLEKNYGIQSDGYLPICISDLKDLSIIDYDVEIDKLCTQLLFVGTYYTPNIIGVLWFIENVLPKLSDCKLTIVGSQMERIKPQINNSMVEVKGWVESLDNAYLEADIVIAPLFDGGGMKIKTAEAFRYGKYFVGTPESLEGYEEAVQSCKEYVFSCSTADEFVRAITGIKSNPESKKANEEVRATFVKNYSVLHERKIFKELQYELNGKMQ